MTERRFTLGLLALEGHMLSSVAGPIDLFRVAQKLAELRDPTTPLRLQTRLIGARGRKQVTSATGQALSGVETGGADPDCLLVPGLMHESVDDLLQRLDGLGPEIALVDAMHRRGVRLAGACSGAFVLAETGLLDGRRATTSWWLDAPFRARYPRIQVDAEQMVVEDGPFSTTGASSAVLTFALRLLGRIGGAELAQQTARMLLLDPDRQSQAPYISRVLAERPRHSLTEKAERLMQQELHGELSIARLAEECGTSERSLLRHFRSHFGSSPIEHLQHLRVERAKALLETTHLSFDEVSDQCGYRDVSSFRKLFKRATTLTPGDYRERFRLRPH